MWNEDQRVEMTIKKEISSNAILLAMFQHASTSNNPNAAPLFNPLLLFALLPSSSSSSPFLFHF